MSTREVMRRLPFVARNEDGTLDFWAVQDTGDARLDYTRGRSYAARFIWLMRAHDAPHLLFHVLEAHLTRASGLSVFRAFMEEANRTVIALSPQRLPLLPVPLPRTISCQSDPREVIDAIPFVSRDAQGRRVHWSPTVTGDYEQDCATGRYYGAAVVHLIHRSRWKNLLSDCFTRIAEAVPVSGQEAVFVGADQVLAEALIAAPETATPYARAAAGFYAGEADDGVSPVPATAWVRSRPGAGRSRARSAALPVRTGSPHRSSRRSRPRCPAR